MVNVYTMFDRTTINVRDSQIVIITALSFWRYKFLNVELEEETFRTMQN